MSNQIDMLLSNKEDIANMLTVLQEASQIELHDEGEYVYERLSNNIAPRAIVRELNKKYDTNIFSTNDIKYFLQRNPDISKKLILQSNELMDSHVKTFMNHELALLKLYEENKELIEKLKSDNDPENLIKAMKSLRDVIMDDAKIRGRFKEGTEINLNVQAKEMVNQVINEPTLLQKDIMKKLNQNDEEDRPEEDSQ